jgi:hypothetical protein
MQNVFEIKIMRWGIKCRITNMSNLHTSSVGGVDLILTSILLPHGKLVKLPRDVICCPYVRVPRRVDVVPTIPSALFTIFSSQV